jgi:excisionase family DNA binding protein
MATTSTPAVPAKLLYGVQEACNLLGVRPTFLFGLLASGQIRSLKVGRLRKITYDDLAAYIERLRAEQSALGTGQQDTAKHDHGSPNAR